MAKEIVIVGAGYAGIAAARQLGKTFKKDESVNITLIDKHSYHTYMTELHEVAGGRVEPDAIKYDLRRIFKKYPKVDLVTDKVTSINYDTKEVVAVQHTYKYDYLLLAMGGEANTFGIEGVKENGFTLWSMEAAERVRAHIINTCYLASREHDEAKRRAMLSFLVCGAGFTGVEMVGELVEWVSRLAHEYKLNKDEFSVHLVEAAPKILAMVTEKEQTKALKYMEKVGINVSLGDGIVKVAKDHVELASGKIIPTYTTIWTAGVQANTETAEFGIEKARAGRLVANEYMEAKGRENVYIAGDLVYYEEPDKNNLPAPQIVQAAEQTGHTAAKNIIAAINGSEKHAFKGKYDGFMVSIGSHYGVALLFDKYHLSGFFAMLMKHIVNLKYFFDIRSLFYMVAYTQHEFFDIKDKRNIFGGFLATKGNNLWTLPLRIFYGAMWLIEGLKKTFGWFGGSTWFKDTVVFPFEWLQPADVTSAASGAEEAVSAASGAADTVAEAAQSVFSLNYVYGEEPMLVLDKMPNWFASIMKFMMPNVEVALFMQRFMSIMEILIGLALIAGVFTWLVSAATVVLVCMFSLSGMFVWVNVWFVPVAIALMNGSGRVFGLDYWIMPWLGKLFDRWLYGKPNHIYSDNIK
ncbi:NAD(P)/FAD-dependent oxidoreductase [Tuanshanicoccus lijuaniae]|uniref:FAD-dependent oxidoreductase n=1 Tax=Aerococcaceae bacterium zg-1292 TaxID=2774330 RepID=UPI001937A8F9|nr:NAD(P)/FAD-dependent oxidoreductase [Aerococcaceae bacterium zg-1292]QQA37805.1 NAD(P)/FAD-dependent oxidoreductase [Aerococcaceae bacterium zg-1292]